jgi:Flp pilus assembly CpaF family ATPase
VKVLTPHDATVLAAALREQWGHRFPPAPPPGRFESDDDRLVREEVVQQLLYDEALPALTRQRLADRAAALTVEDEDELVRLVVDGLSVHARIGALLSDPGVTDVEVFGARTMAVHHADGSVAEMPSPVRTDDDLVRLAYDLAAQGGRPFNYEHPVVDLDLPGGVRLHAEGFDTCFRPFLALRRNRLPDVTLDDLVDLGSVCAVQHRLFRALVKADVRLVVTGAMGAGKSTLLRAIAMSCIDPHQVVVTVETDLELGLHRSGVLRFVHARQARLATGVDGRGIGVGDMMAAAARTNAHWLIVGECRQGDETRALVEAMSIGRGCMTSVHGFSAVDGLERLAELMYFDCGVPFDTGLRLVHKNVDVVVHCDRDAASGARFVSEIVVPGVDAAGTIVQHLFVRGPDGRAVPGPTPPSGALLARLHRADPGFALEPWLDTPVLASTSGSWR